MLCFEQTLFPFVPYLGEGTNGKSYINYHPLYQDNLILLKQRMMTDTEFEVIFYQQKKKSFSRFWNDDIQVIYRYFNLKLTHVMKNRLKKYKKYKMVTERSISEDEWYTIVTQTEHRLPYDILEVILYCLDGFQIQLQRIILTQNAVSKSTWLKINGFLENYTILDDWFQEYFSRNFLTVSMVKSKF